MRLTLLIIMLFPLLVYGQESNSLDSPPREHGIQMGIYGGIGIATPQTRFDLPVYQAGINFIFSLKKIPNIRFELLLHYQKDQLYHEEFDISHSENGTIELLLHLPIFIRSKYRLFIATGPVLGFTSFHQYKGKVIYTSSDFTVLDGSKKGERTGFITYPNIGWGLSFKQEYKITNSIYLHCNLDAISQFYPLYPNSGWKGQLKNTFILGLGVSYNFH